MSSIGRYRVIRELGHGGMGHVFLAHDPSLERDVAIKLLHREAAGGLRGEAKALAALSHPGIVTVFEIGEHDGHDYIAMEYVAGRTLRELLDERAVKPVLLSICAKVAKAVAAAHRAGILHRDIKPENIVITDDGAVKVVDFGIARRLSEQPHAANAQDVVDALSKTMEIADTILSPGTHTAFGTPAYMAPEVLLGETSNEKSDVYSLGVVLYECITGKRPHDGTLVEVIAQVIDGPRPKLDDRDPLAPLVERMLVRDPAKRPALDKVAAALNAPHAPRRKRTNPIAFALAGVAAVAIAVTGWLWHAAASAPPPAAVPHAPVTATLGIAPLDVVIPSYGAEAPKADAFAAILATRIGQADGAKLTAIRLSDRAAARTVHASYLVAGAIRETEHRLRADLEIVNVATGDHVANVRVEKPLADAAPLLTKLAQEIARDIAPDAVLPTAPDRVRAQAFYGEGKPLLDAGRFTDARPYFEQAVDADPDFFDAWYGLALALSWMDAPEARVSAAVARALALAPAGSKQALVRGQAAFLAGDFTAARDALEPLEPIIAPNTPERRELDYYLGEANWHDGRHAAGFAYFKRVLDFDPHFGAAIVHAWQYAVARHDAETARYYTGLGAENKDWPELAAGHFQHLADTGGKPFRAWAQIVLGRSSPEIDELVAGDGLDARTYRLAFALRDGQLDRARAVFGEIWDAIAAVDLDQQPTMLGGLEAVAEVTLCGGMTDETRRVVTLLSAHARGRARHGAQRLATLAAAPLADPSLIPTAGVGERTAKLVAAARAELAGDRAEAAKILRGVVDDPTFSWDYPERAALIRNLRALGRRKDLAAVCAETLHPAVFRPAQIVLQRTCKHN